MLAIRQLCLIAQWRLFKLQQRATFKLRSLIKMLNDTVLKGRAACVSNQGRGCQYL